MSHEHRSICAHCHFWQPACIKGTGEQTLSACIPGDQADQFSTTVSFFWSHQKSWFPLFSLGLIAVMLSLALLRFSLIKFKAWSTGQLASFSEFLNLPTSPLFSVISTGNQSAARFTTKIALTCFYIVSGTAPPHLSELLHIYSPSCCLCSAVDTRIFHVPRMGRRTIGQKILLIHWTCALELTSSLCQAFVFILFF